MEGISSAIFRKWITPPEKLYAGHRKSATQLVKNMEEDK